MTRSLLLASLVLIATAASAQADRARPSTTDRDADRATLSIDYEQRRGDLRRATLTLAPASKDTPIRQLDQMAILSTSGQWITLDTILSSGFGSTAQAMLPAPDAILIILVKPERGPWRGWKVEDSSPEARWTYFDQRGRQVRSAPCSARECFGTMMDAFDQARSTASRFQMDLILSAEHEEEID